MSASSVSSSTAHAISPEAITAWNDLTVSAPDGRVRVVTLEAVSTKAQRNATSGESNLVDPMPVAVRPVQATNDAPPEPAEPSAATDAQAQSRPAVDNTALLDFALGLCEQGESATSIESIDAASEPGGAEMQPAQGLPARAADEPDATVSSSLETQPQGEPHAGI
jgi:hypothetical protein